MGKTSQAGTAVSCMRSRNIVIAVIASQTRRKLADAIIQILNQQRVSHQVSVRKKCSSIESKDQCDSFDRVHVCCACVHNVRKIACETDLPT